MQQATNLTEQDIMLSIWREAGKSPEGITIPCSTEGNAKRMRFALYNAVKPIKTGKLPGDGQLKQAIATCSLSFTPDKRGLVIRPKITTELNQSLLAALRGKEVGKVEDLLLGESLARLVAAAPEEVTKQLATSTGTDTGTDKGKASAYGARGV